MRNLYDGESALVEPRGDADRLLCCEGVAHGVASVAQGGVYNL
ncbi:hypothetical protein SDC9_186009 [bioreactor metagenome]|uniref:Uncharacterized protein n=1 Tax=bioreactor metagenome TaxID=1076179 RepID=A0A645HHH1_9ZZZZ